MRQSPESFLQGTHAIIGWDIDGVLCSTSRVEKWLEKSLPSFIPRVQAFFQSSTGIFVPERTRASKMFLAKRTLSDDGFQALISSNEEAGKILGDSNTVVRNAIYTDRPYYARNLIFDQLTEALQRFKEGLEVGNLVEEYFDNPLGEDPRQVKVRAAQGLENLGIEFHLVEDKISTALAVKQTAPTTNVYLLLPSQGKENICAQNGITPVYSASQFVQKAFESIRKTAPNNSR